VDGRYKVEHPFSYNEPKGKMIVVYATAEVEGFGPRSIVLRKDEVEAARKFSKAPNSPAWTNHYPMMAKKTAIRQLAKFLPKSILEEFSKGVAIDEQETFVEASQAAQQRIEGDMGSEPVDVQFEEDKKENDKHKLPANKDHDGKKEATEHSEPATPPANNKKSKPVLDVKYQCTYSVGCGKMYYGTKDGVIYGGDGKELGKDSTGNYLCTDCGYTVERCKNKDEAM
jgi:recombinational DNA repair protein RecT